MARSSSSPPSYQLHLTRHIAFTENTRGVSVKDTSADVIPKASCFRQQILLDASAIRLGSLPLGVYAASPAQEQAVFEVCVCPSGKVYLSPAKSSSTCQSVSNICLWS